MFESLGVMVGYRAQTLIWARPHWTLQSIITFLENAFLNLNQPLPGISSLILRSPHLPPCRACSLHPLFWLQNPPGGHWCQSRTFWLGPECWSEHWRASHLQRGVVGRVMREKIANQQWQTLNWKLCALVCSSDYLCVSLTGYCADALMPWQSVK